MTIYLPTNKNLTHDNEPISQLYAQVENCYLKAEHFFKRSFPRPAILLNLRGNNAGTATPQKNLLRFNQQLLQENHQHFLNQTVPHEVAHLIAYFLFGLSIKPHGKEWQHIMTAVYQLPPKRCHQYAIIKKKQQCYIYRCNCSNINHPLTIRRHNFIQKGYKYICKRCKATLVFTDQVDVQ